MDKQDVETLRLQLLANGYTPIRNMDKRTFMPSWPSAHIDEAEVKSWTRKFSRHAATGLRVDNGLAVIDFDVDDEEAMDAIEKAVLEKHPELMKTLLRFGKGAKQAWFLRCEEPFTRLHTRAFIKPGQVADDGTHRVEIFGGASPRQFGAFGPHTVDDVSREVKVWYEWADNLSPATVPLADLLEVPKATMWSVVDLAEEVLDSLGWTIHEKSSKGESASGKVYDLHDGMLFECNDDVTRTLDELREAAGVEEGHLRCSASWLEGPTAKRLDRCLVSLSRSGRVAIWESMDGLTHCELEDKPAEYGTTIDRYAEKLEELKVRRRTKLTHADDFNITIQKLLASYAYCPGLRNSIVPLYATALDEGYHPSAFRMLMAPFAHHDKGKRGGDITINPADVWVQHEGRVTVDGLRMRPDMPRPTYEENGKTYVNVYSPPVHDAEGGDASMGIDFIKHLIPDLAERDWFLKWLSFKLQFPHIPGPAVVMVAHRKFGTGRGTLVELISRLIGAQYVRQLPFSTFTGRTYQAQYNEWQSEALMVCVNESAETDNGSTYQTKVNTYEHLKDIVEPRQTVREIKRKTEKNYWALSCTTFLIATNHRDALPIPETDRRFCILKNGEPRSVDYWQRLNRWMDDPANVADFFNWLVDRGFEGYAPYDTPPVFNAKAEMIEEAKSDLDHALELALLNMQGEVFTLKQLEKYVRLVAEQSGLELPKPFDAVFRKISRRMLTRVGVRNGQNWHPQFGKERHSVYARDDADALKWTASSADDLRGEIARNGDADGGGSSVLSGFFARNKPSSE